MPTAIKIQGRVGRHQFINDVYEPMQIKHHDKDCWVARSVAPRYLFHNGKTRWVISKQLDDGARCWAYVKDSGNTCDPSQCNEPWQCCNDDNEWGADQGVKCASVPADSDKFVQLRMTLDADMRQYGLVELKDVRQLWKRLDYNGNNVVSLAEIDKMVVELVKGGVWPAWLNNKPALMRAYKKTILKDGDGDDWVEKKEFHALLLNIFWFNKLWKIFDVMDTGDDRRIDCNEFCRGMDILGLNMSNSEAQQEFNKIDMNHGGQVLFVEFCAYIRGRVNPDSHAEFDGDIVSGTTVQHGMRKHHGHKATHDKYVTKKNLREFNELEAKFKSFMSNNKKLKEMWGTMDFNGNNIVSLAEIDKWVVEQYPLLNHKPALMRAYKKTLQMGNDDDWVQKKEFKNLLGQLFYFNKVYWLFDQADGDDRRMTYPEFRKCNTIIGNKMSDAECKQEFGRIDRNGGGMILFDEFCRWVTSTSCPHAMEELMD